MVFTTNCHGYCMSCCSIRPEEVGNVHMHCLLYGGFHTFLHNIHASRKLNVIDSSVITLVITTSIKILRVT